MIRFWAAVSMQHSLPFPLRCPKGSHEVAASLEAKKKATDAKAKTTFDRSMADRSKAASQPTRCPNLQGLRLKNL